MEKNTRGRWLKGALLFLATAAGGFIFVAVFIAHPGQTLAKKTPAGQTRAHLDALRSELALFYRAYGTYPQTIDELRAKGFLPRGMPTALVPVKSDQIRYARSAAEVSDLGGWLYVNDPASSDFGMVLINSGGKDQRGRVWSTF